MKETSKKDFKIEKELGKGSFGSVYLVRRKRDNKIYALKTVIMAKLSKKEQENSVNEVRILASVNHPNVIGYKEAFWDDDGSSLNIVMEYADDGDLHTKIEKMKKEGGLFTEARIWSYAIQMIEGLKALHDKKIMHRDLKSANIFLVNDKHQCKIGDMNVSKVIKEKVLRTQTGTPYYASPEVWNDAPYSYKSDLWSIGCVIYELCELKPPFHGKDLDELYENVCKGKPERINKNYSDDLWKMILMLLQVDVNKRVDCNKFLNSDLIKKKIEEMKNDEKTCLEGMFLEKNKKIEDDFLLKTIKFNDISEIKAQLPTKKNYNNFPKSMKPKKLLDKNKIHSKESNLTKSKEDNTNNEYLRKIENLKKEKEALKKEILDFNKMKDYITKKEKVKTNEDIKNKDIIGNMFKIRQRAGNYIKENYQNLIKPKTLIYKKTKNLAPPQTVKREGYKKKSNQEIEAMNANSSKKILIPNSERRQKICLTELYLKKYPTKGDKGNKTATKKEKKIPINFPNSVKRMKSNNLLTDEQEATETNNNNYSSILDYSNKYIYSKKNSLVKKVDINLNSSANSLYKRIIPSLNSNIMSQYSLRKLHTKQNNFTKDSNMISEKLNNKLKKQDSKKLIENKMNKYNSYGSPLLTNISNKGEGTRNHKSNNEINKLSMKLNNGSYIKKLNTKSSKIKNENGDKNIEKKIKDKITNKRKINIYTGNSSNILDNNSNTFLQSIKYINNTFSNTNTNPILDCYLSPKCHDSHIYNNFYSFNYADGTNPPVKVINVYKK